MKTKHIILTLLACAGVASLTLVLPLRNAGPGTLADHSSPPAAGSPNGTDKTDVHPRAAPPGEEIVLPERTEEDKRRWMETMAVFHGKVVDQHGDPVPDTEVEFNRPPFGDEPRTMVPTWRTRTDAKGLFSIRQPQAPKLHIRVSCPPGYYSTGEQGKDFNFHKYRDSFFAQLPESMRSSKNQPHVADPANPVIFRLKKMGQTEPMIHRYQRGENKGEQDFQIGTGPGHILRLKYRIASDSGKDEAPDKRRVDEWSFELFIAGGGLVARKDPQSTEASSFIAPEDGYSGTVARDYNFARDGKKYTTFEEREYFARFSDGTHARIVVNLVAKADRPRIRVESWYNPKPGSRATEFDPSKKIEMPEGQ